MEGLELLLSKEDGLTWGDLKGFLDQLTPDQLSTKAKLWRIDGDSGEIPGHVILEVNRATVDHIDPTGDGAEPVSLYEEDEYDISEEPVVIKKGELIIFI